MRLLRFENFETKNINKERVEVINHAHARSSIVDERQEMF